MSNEIVVEVPTIGPNGVFIKLIPASTPTLIPASTPTLIPASTPTPKRSLVKITSFTYDRDTRIYKFVFDNGNTYTPKKDVYDIYYCNKNGQDIGSVFDITQKKVNINDETYVHVDDFNEFKTSGGRLRRSNRKSHKFYKKSTKRSASRKYRR